MQYILADGELEGQVITRDERRVIQTPCLPVEEQEELLCYQRRAWGSGEPVLSMVGRRHCPMVLATPRYEACRLTVHWVAKVRAIGKKVPAVGSFVLAVDTRAGAGVGQGSDATPPIDVLQAEWDKGDEALARGHFRLQHPGGGMLVVPLCMWASGSGYAFRWVAASIVDSA